MVSTRGVRRARRAKRGENRDLPSTRGAPARGVAVARGPGKMAVEWRSGGCPGGERLQKTEGWAWGEEVLENGPRRIRYIMSTHAIG